MTRETWLDDVEERARRQHIIHGDRSWCFSSSGQRGNRADSMLRILARGGGR